MATRHQPSDLHRGRDDDVDDKDSCSPSVLLSAKSSQTEHTITDGGGSRSMMHARFSPAGSGAVLVVVNKIINLHARNSFLGNGIHMPSFLPTKRIVVGH